MQVGDACRNGHIVSGSNIQMYVHKGVQRVRCATCNVPPRHSSLTFGDTCKNGHVISEANHYRRGETILCAECKREAARRYARSEKGRQADARKYSVMPDWKKHERQRVNAEKRAAERADEYITQHKDDQAFQYLMLGKRAQRANEALWESYKKAEPKCLNNPAPYIDYAEENTPSQSDAYMLCKGCPILVECGRFANAYKPPVGVWAGQVWVNGLIKEVSNDDGT